MGRLWVRHNDKLAKLVETDWAAIMALTVESLSDMWSEISSELSPD